MVGQFVSDKDGATYTISEEDAHSTIIFSCNACNEYGCSYSDGSLEVQNSPPVSEIISLNYPSWVIENITINLNYYPEDIDGDNLIFYVEDILIEDGLFEYDPSNGNVTFMYYVEDEYGLVSESSFLNIALTNEGCTCDGKLCYFGEGNPDNYEEEIEDHPIPFGDNPGVSPIILFTQFPSGEETQTGFDIIFHLSEPCAHTQFCQRDDGGEWVGCSFSFDESTNCGYYGATEEYYKWKASFIYTNSHEDLTLQDYPNIISISNNGEYDAADFQDDGRISENSGVFDWGVVYSDPAYVYIPEGSNNIPTTFTVQKLEDEIIPPPLGFTLRGDVYSFGPNDFIFDEDVLISVPYNGGDLANLKVGRLNSEGGSEWEILPTRILEGQGKVDIDNLGIYAVFEETSVIDSEIYCISTEINYDLKLDSGAIGFFENVIFGSLLNIYNALQVTFSGTDYDTNINCEEYSEDLDLVLNHSNLSANEINCDNDINRIINILGEGAFDINV